MNVLLCGHSKDSARIRLLAVRQEGKVLITNLLDVEIPASCPDICLSQVLNSIDDGRAECASYPVVVRFPHASNCGDDGFQKEMLCEVRNALLGEDEVGLELDNLLAYGLDLLLFGLQDACPVLFLRDLDVRPALAPS